MGCVEALITLETDELALAHLRENLRDFGFADARFALNEQRPSHLNRQVNCDRQTALRHIVVVDERAFEIINRGGKLHPVTLVPPDLREFTTTPNRSTSETEYGEELCCEFTEICCDAGEYTEEDHTECGQADSESDWAGQRCVLER